MKSFFLTKWSAFLTFLPSPSLHDFPFTIHKISLHRPSLIQVSQIKYTANFAYSGNPSKGIHVPLLPWQAYNKANLTSLVFETPKNSLAMNIWYDECDFWDKMGYNWGW